MTDVSVGDAACERPAQRGAPRVRLARRSDADVLSRTLGRAFIDDPFMSHLLPDRAQRPAKLPRLFRVLFKLCEPHGACHVTSEGEAAALWLPPNKTTLPMLDYVRNLGDFLGVFGLGGGLRALAAMDQVEKAHPHEPHWYLLAIGTDPGHQGKGFGSAIMRKQLRKIDAEAMPAYLETVTPKNVSIYRSFGFETIGELQMPDGPLVKRMWRDAQS